MATPEPLIVADPHLLPLPDGKQFYLHDEMFPTDERGREIPNFSISEAGKMFFGQTVEWMRWRHREGYFILEIDGVRTKVGNKRDPRTNFRYYTLADIERMAHALGQHQGAFNGQQVRRCVLLAKTVAEMRGVI